MYYHINVGRVGEFWTGYALVEISASVGYRKIQLRKKSWKNIKTLESMPSNMWMAGQPDNIYGEACTHAIKYRINDMKCNSYYEVLCEISFH